MGVCENPQYTIKFSTAAAGDDSWNDYQVDGEVKVTTKLFITQEIHVLKIGLDLEPCIAQQEHVLWLHCLSEFLLTAKICPSGKVY